MFKRVDKLLIELPTPEYGDANAAAAVQDLLGGKFGEMSTLNNYMYQSFNFRGKKKLKPFYDLVASITAEEFGHVELVANNSREVSRMVNENEYVRPTMPYYPFYQQPMQTAPYYYEMFDDRSFYYQPNMGGGYMYPTSGGYMPYMNSGNVPSNINSGYMPSNMNTGYIPNYTNEGNYTQQSYYPEASPEGIATNRVMQQFLDENGQVDIQKMLQTVGQFADTVQQVSPVIKQLNDLVRSFRA